MLKEVLFLVLAALCLSDVVSIENNFDEKQRKIHELLLFVKQNDLMDAKFYTIGRYYKIENNIEMYKNKVIIHYV